MGISQGWKLTGATETAERKLADGSLRHGGQALMSWAVANARVEPKGNAIIITKTGVGLGQHRSDDGGIQRDGADVDKPMVVETTDLCDLN